MPPYTPDQRTLEQQLVEETTAEVYFDRVHRGLYATDASVYQIMPLGVVVPRLPEDVVQTLELCRTAGISITARGGGTSQAGQAVGSGLQIDFSRHLNRVLEVDAAAGWVRVQPGIVLDELNAHLRPHGLHLPLDISTSDRATVGGMIANNSAGTRSVLYGKTLDYVLELTVLLADGTVCTFDPVPDEVELERRCARPGLEGQAYRTVRRLAAEHAGEIVRRYPRILRRVGGYNLDEFVPGRWPFSLARLIVGSEGTLALVLEAKLRLAPLPRAKSLAVVQFDSLLEALEATPYLLTHSPSAVELVDRFVLEPTRTHRRFRAERDEFIQGDPAAILMVEVLGDEPTELERRLDAMQRALAEAGLGSPFVRVPDPAAQGRAWSLRRAALGLSMAGRGDARACSFVEDTAVDPARLRDYIERFLGILAAHHTTAGFYAHASVGLLHVRPVVNLKTADGVERFAHIADAIADLVLEFGGALSGEHGDGLVRGPFQERMFGLQLYGAFRELKQAFDPYAVFNPGKIVDSPPLTDNLRFGATYLAREPLTVLNFDDFGGIARAAEQCAGIGECRKRLSGSMCPSFMATRDESASTRGRANTLRLALSGQLGPEGLADRSVRSVLDLCLECKACKAECPTGVDMARLKAETLYQQHRAHGPPLRDRILARPDRLGVWGSYAPELANQILAGPVGRWAAQLLGLDPDVGLPRVAERAFSRSQHPELDRARLGGLHPVVLFVDTFSNYFEPEVAHAAVELVLATGNGVIPIHGICCGRPQLSRGFLPEARQQAERVLEVLGPVEAMGYPIVFLEPSCLSMIQDDYEYLVPAPRRRALEALRRLAVSFEAWAADGSALRGPRATGHFAAPPGPLLVQPHCHQASLGQAPACLRALEGLPNARVTLLDAGCCGMAGSFGYEHPAVSRSIAEQRLLPALQGVIGSPVAVSSGYSCRRQLTRLWGGDTRHPAVLLRDLWRSESDGGV